MREEEEEEIHTRKTWRERFCPRRVEMQRKKREKVKMKNEMQKREEEKDMQK